MAVQNLLNKIGVGVIIRNSHGVVLASLMKHMHYCVEPSIAEVRGLFVAATFCKELGLNSLVFEGDSMVFVQVASSQALQDGKLSCIINNFHQLWLLFIEKFNMSNETLTMEHIS